MLIFTSHNLNHCFESRGTRSLWNVFEAVQKTRSTCFIGSKNTRLRLVFLNPIKHSCSFFKHYIMVVPLTHSANSKQVDILFVHLLDHHRVKALHHNVEVQSKTLNALVKVKVAIEWASEPGRTRQGVGTSGLQNR